MMQPLTLNNNLPSVFFVTCASGFEQALCEELNEIYCSYNIQAEVELGSAGCYVTGSFDCCILANLISFCASRVLYVGLECEVENEQELYDAVCTLDWPSLFDVNKTFLVKSNVSQSFLQNSMYLSLKVKDALCDTFTQKIQSRPNVDIKNAEVKVYVRLVRNRLSVSLDTSGDPLFMRGYKKNSLEAPLKETLAASLLRISGWNKLTNSILQSADPVFFERVVRQPEEENAEQKRRIPKEVLLSPFLLDQFCGSGTIVIEAALAAIQFNPNCLRPHFSYMNLFPTEQENIVKKYEILKAQVLANKRCEYRERGHESLRKTKWH
ncbi:MAG: THUMP domain-containing protein [Bdellovibrionota bacterium]